jgi:hypothetical protein
MKNICFLLTFIIVSSISVGQKISDTQIANNYYYCELWCKFQQAKFGDGKYKINVDFGQERSTLFKDEVTRAQEIEKINSFTTKVDALNYLTDKNWVLVESHTYAPEMGFQFFYLLKKRKD